MAVAFVAAVQNFRTDSDSNLNANGGVWTVTVTGTVAAGELLILKTGTGSRLVTCTAVSDGQGNTWTRRVQVPVTASNAHANVWSATAASSGSLTVTATITNTGTSVVVPQVITLERYTGAAVGTGTNTATGNTTGQGSITTAVPNSVAVWVVADFNGVTGTATYVSSNTATIAAYQQSGAVSVYNAYRTTTTAGAYAYGITAPITGSVFVLAALELTSPISATATLASTSSLTATAQLTEFASATLASTSSLSATTTLAAIATATLASTSSLTATGKLAPAIASGTLASTSSLTATAQLTEFAAATLASTSSLTATAKLTEIALATLASTSSLTASANPPDAPGQATLAAVSGLSIGPGTLAGVSSATLAAVSSLTATPDIFTPPFIWPAGPILRPAKTPVMRLLVADTITGRVGYELPWDTLQWNTPLNSAGTMSSELVVEAMLDAFSDQGADDPAAVLREFLTGPWRYSLAVAYGNDVLCAGPYLPAQDPPDKSTVSIQGVELSKIFDRRLVYGAVGGDVWNTPDYDLVLRNFTLPGLVYLLVGAAITTSTFSPNRSLPITCANPPALTGLETRTYFAYDLTTVTKAISDIVTADGGPDWRLDPYLAQGSDGNYLQWELRIGNPTIDTAPVYTWDDTLSLIQRDIDASAMTTSIWVPGNGQDRDKLIAWQSDSSLPTNLVGRGFPSLETVDSNHSSETDQRVLESWATADLNAGNMAVDTWTLKVPVDGDPPAGAYRVGDVARIDIARHRTIEPGTYLRRITEVSGDGSPWIQIVCGDADATTTG